MKWKTPLLRPARVALVVCAASAMVGCGDDPDMEDGTPMDMPDRHNYAVEIQASHTHIMLDATVPFAIRDLDKCTDPADPATCQLVPGLPITLFTRYVKQTATSEFPLEPGVLEDNGDGTYSFYHAFGLVGANIIGLKFQEEGHYYFEAFPYDTSKGGGEGYQCNTTPESDSTVDHIFQVRWDPSLFPIVADGTEVAFNLELQRSFNTTLNLESPWSNSFDHLTPANLTAGLPIVKLMAGEGEGATELAELTPAYIGKGIYQVKTAFEESWLEGELEQTFWLKVSFDDDLGCSLETGVIEVKDRDQFYFPVEAP